MSTRDYLGIGSLRLIYFNFPFKVYSVHNVVNGPDTVLIKYHIGGFLEVMFFVPEICISSRL
eukprot:jgi/Botrbrau1/14553/Bobra.0170s0009.1